MPSADFLSCMSRDFTKLLDNKDECNVTIKVGPKGKLFRAHSIILRARSPYFQKAINKRNADVTLNKWLIKMPQISPPVFELILRYIYGGNIAFEKVDTEVVLNFLAAAGILRLEDLFEHLQAYLLEEKCDWLREHIVATCRVAEEHPTFKQLRHFCKRIKDREPDLFFKSTDFSLLSEKSLVRLLQRDDLGMEEVEIWDRVIKWGTDNTPQQPRIRRSSGPNYEGIEKTLHKCIPHIRFFHISAADFRMKVAPYKTLLPPSVYTDLFRYHADPKYKAASNNIEARHGAIESEIIDMRQAALIASWIDRRDSEASPTSIIPYKVSESPYELQLLMRGTQHGFTAEAFHEHCDNRGPNIVLMKVRGSTEIIGGYNPVHWESNLVDFSTTESFLFSIRQDDDNPRHAVLSRVKSAKHAIVCAPDHGPTFGSSYALSMREDFNDPEKTGCIAGTSVSYNIALRTSEERYFWVDEYEVFQVLKRPEFDSSKCVGK